MDAREISRSTQTQGGMKWLLRLYWKWRIMVDLTTIEQATARISAAATRIKAGVEALQSQIDPTVQARVNAAGALLGDIADVLDGILPAGNGEEPPPPPPSGPPA